MDVATTYWLFVPKTFQCNKINNEIKMESIPWSKIKWLSLFIAAVSTGCTLFLMRMYLCLCCCGYFFAVIHSFHSIKYTQFIPTKCILKRYLNKNKVSWVSELKRTKASTRYFWNLENASLLANPKIKMINESDCDWIECEKLENFLAIFFETIILSSFLGTPSEILYWI